MYRQVIGRPQSHQGLDRVLGKGQVEAVEALAPIALLESEDAEDRVRTDSEELETDDPPLLLNGDDANGSHELCLSLEDRTDGLPLDIELGRPDSLDLRRDL